MQGVPHHWPPAVRPDHFQMRGPRLQDSGDDILHSYLQRGHQKGKSLIQNFDVRFSAVESISSLCSLQGSWSSAVSPRTALQQSKSTATICCSYGSDAIFDETLARILQVATEDIRVEPFKIAIKDCKAIDFPHVIIGVATVVALPGWWKYTLTAFEVNSQSQLFNTNQSWQSFLLSGPKQVNLRLTQHLEFVVRASACLSNFKPFSISANSTILKTAMCCSMTLRTTLTR